MVIEAGDGAPTTCAMIGAPGESASEAALFLFAMAFAMAKRFGLKAENGLA